MCRCRHMSAHEHPQVWPSDLCDACIESDAPQFQYAPTQCDCTRVQQRQSTDVLMLPHCRSSSCEQVEGSSFTLTKELAVFERKAPGRRANSRLTMLLTRNQMEKQTVNAFTPGVIEPSFGTKLRVLEAPALCATESNPQGRTSKALTASLRLCSSTSTTPVRRIHKEVSAVYFHCVFVAITQEEAGDDKDKQTRGVLAFAPSSAPYKCAGHVSEIFLRVTGAFMVAPIHTLPGRCVILPLDQRIARDERYLNMMDAGSSAPSRRKQKTCLRRFARHFS